MLLFSTDNICLIKSCTTPLAPLVKGGTGDRNQLPLLRGEQETKISFSLIKGRTALRNYSFPAKRLPIPNSPNSLVLPQLPQHRYS
jgi:hypothetical protein